MKESTKAWQAVFGFILLTGLLILVGLGKLVSFVFPPGALVLAWFLYKNHPQMYLGFVWWLWFLSPLVRRLADYKGGGFTDPSPVLLAPYLAVLVTLPTLSHCLIKRYTHDYLPFLLCFSGLFYGLAIGLIENSLVTTCIKFLDWFVPALFGFYLFDCWRDYPANSQTTQRIFLFGALIMGVYGVIQFLILPEWDRFWIINSAMASAGAPEAQKLNIHSTMNDRGAFAMFMMTSLLIILKDKSIFGISASAIGFLALLLTRVRTIWISLLIGLLILFTSLKSNLQIRLVLTLLVISLCAVPLVTLDPFAERIGERLETFSNLEEDNSFQARQGIYAGYSDSIFNNILGNGIGGGVGDSGILTTLMQLGWIGTSFYWSGIILLVFTLFYPPLIRFDQFTTAARAIVISALSILPVGNPMDGLSGVILWSFLGISLAAKKYYRKRSQ